MCECSACVHVCRGRGRRGIYGRTRNRRMRGDIYLMRELGEEGLTVTRLWLGEQTAVSHVTVKMDTLVNHTLTESMCDSPCT